MERKLTRLDARDRRLRLEHAYFSALVPGLGQLAQRRFRSALVQFGTVASYVVGSFGLHGERAMLLGLFCNVWSSIDAYRHEAD
jgi:hypothetical protein